MASSSEIVSALQQDALQEAHRNARGCAALFSLPLRRHIWRGQAGDLGGRGTGNSIDFHDHRSYLPGDDPRHINWQAYARTGNYVLKLFREEVRPVIDIIMDTSASMFFDPDKGRRAAELLLWSVESALRSGASLQVWLAAGEKHVPVPAESILGHAWPTLRPDTPGSPDRAPEIGRIPLRASAMRVFISDLLYPGAPDAVTHALSVRSGRGVVLAPFCAAEATPDWTGNHEFVDSESGALDQRRIEPWLLKRYTEAWQRHFELWKTAARRHGIPLARVPAEPALPAALRLEALPSGAAEW